MAKYPYIVNYNGVWYPAGSEVPAGTSFAEEISEEQKTYTKTEINRMPASELKALAIENGIAEAEEKSGTEIKKLLIEKFGL